MSLSDVIAVIALIASLAALVYSLRKFRIEVYPLVQPWLEWNFDGAPTYFSVSLANLSTTVAVTDLEVSLKVRDPANRLGWHNWVAYETNDPQFSTPATPKRPLVLSPGAIKPGVEKTLLSLEAFLADKIPSVMLLENKEKALTSPPIEEPRYRLLQRIPLVVLLEVKYRPGLFRISHRSAKHRYVMRSEWHADDGLIHWYVYDRYIVRTSNMKTDTEIRAELFPSARAFWKFTDW